MFPSPDFYPCVAAKPKQSQNQIILSFEHMQVHYMLVLSICICLKLLSGNKRKNKGMGNFVIAFCSLCVQCSFCVIVSKLRGLSLICVCTACFENIQVLLSILLNLLWFLWFKQMKTSQEDISPVSTIKCQNLFSHCRNELASSLHRLHL